jgi:hypothetical protein
LGFPLVDSWADILGIVTQVVSLSLIVFAASAVKQLQRSLISDKMNPKLVKNIKNSRASMRQFLSEDRILDHGTAIYFERVCQNMIDLNSQNRRSFTTAARIRWYKLSAATHRKLGSHPRAVLKSLQAFDLFVEAWLTRFETSEAYRKERKRYASPK